MPPRKQSSPAVNGDSASVADGVDQATEHVDALALAEEAEAEAAEAEAAAAAARARARAIRLRREANAATAVSSTDSDSSEAAVVAEPTETDVVDETEPAELAADAEAPDAEAPASRRRLKLPRVSLKALAAAVVCLCVVTFLVLTALMMVHHRGVQAERQRSAEFAAAARQGVVTLMSLNFNTADDDVKRIIDSTTGDFRKEFESQATDFAKVAHESKVITVATVNGTGVKSMTKDTANVLVAVTTNVSNTASKQQQPRSWRLSVDVARDGDQIKLAKVEFVP
jgi:Mce-associated membrane protein